MARDATNDELICPVCGEVIRPDEAVARDEEGRTVHARCLNEQ